MTTPDPTAVPGVPSAADLPTVDDYLTKLAKYVPVEALTVTTLGFSAFTPKGNNVWLLLTIGAAANILYLFGTTIRNRTTTPPPRWFFYVLALGAFFAWAVATLGPVQAAIGMTGEHVETQAAFILFFAAFIIPALEPVLGVFDTWLLDAPDPPPGQ